MSDPVNPQTSPQETEGEDEVTPEAAVGGDKPLSKKRLKAERLVQALLQHKKHVQAQQEQQKQEQEQQAAEQRGQPPIGSLLRLIEIEKDALAHEVRLQRKEKLKELRSKMPPQIPGQSQPSPEELVEMILEEQVKKLQEVREAEETIRQIIRKHKQEKAQGKGKGKGQPPPPPTSPLSPSFNMLLKELRKERIQRKKDMKDEKKRMRENRDMAALKRASLVPGTIETDLEAWQQRTRETKEEKKQRKKDEKWDKMEEKKRKRMEKKLSRSKPQLEHEEVQVDQQDWLQEQPWDAVQDQHDETTRSQSETNEEGNQFKLNMEHHQRQILAGIRGQPMQPLPERPRIDQAERDQLQRTREERITRNSRDLASLKELFTFIDEGVGGDNPKTTKNRGGAHKAQKKERKLEKRERLVAERNEGRDSTAIPSEVSSTLPSDIFSSLQEDKNKF
ncbi:hypothetical protein QBC35DRAFT_473907 [Podospora australis]|uniref:Uncharacterized protein n=1 Tax=Podospora australis TaxID=1536484 RepID=A0AAN7AIS3_9PEZI|nr:hypothetical protein QBC35DRAFT_473907 [Podospora australis]